MNIKKQSDFAATSYKVHKAESAGFCFGVNRAIKMVEELLDKNYKVCTLGPIIHNMEVVRELEQRGCRLR